MKAVSDNWFLVIPVSYFSLFSRMAAPKNNEENEFIDERLKGLDPKIVELVTNEVNLLKVN